MTLDIKHAPAEKRTKLKWNSRFDLETEKSILACHCSVSIGELVSSLKQIGKKASGVTTETTWTTILKWMWFLFSQFYMLFAYHVNQPDIDNGNGISMNFKWTPFFRWVAEKRMQINNTDIEIQICYMMWWCFVGFALAFDGINTSHHININVIIFNSSTCCLEAMAKGKVMYDMGLCTHLLYNIIKWIYDT